MEIADVLFPDACYEWVCRPFRSHSCSAVHALTCVSISQIVQGYLLLSFARFLSISCISVLAICFSLCSHKPTGVSQLVLCFLSAVLAMLVRDLDVLFHYIVPRFDVTSVSTCSRLSAACTLLPLLLIDSQGILLRFDVTSVSTSPLRVIINCVLPWLSPHAFQGVRRSPVI